MPKKKTSKRKKKLELRRFAEYLVSGGVYFWTGYLAFFVLDKGLHLDLFWAKTLANIAGWTINYGLQRFWVFKNPSLSKHRTEVTFRYTVITLLDFALDYLIVAGLKNLGITPYIGQFVSAGFFTVWNYLWYKLWVFTNRVHRKPRKRAA